MRLVLATAAVLAAFVAPAHADYTRECGGVLDIECHGTVCPMDCFPRDCLVWVDVLHNATTAQCVSPLAP